eukprot:scaffold37434_cov60-Phaeocystis_antarctica.AAC.2
MPWPAPAREAWLGWPSTASTATTSASLAVLLLRRTAARDPRRWTRSCGGSPSSARRQPCT